MLHNGPMCVLGEDRTPKACAGQMATFAAALKNIDPLRHSGLLRTVAGLKRGDTVGDLPQNSGIDGHYQEMDLRSQDATEILDVHHFRSVKLA